MSDRSREISVSCAVLASVAFSLNDASVKWLSGDYPLHQLILMRSMVALSITLAIVVPLEGGWSRLRTRRPMMHVLRGFCVVLANLAFFCGIAVIPLAEATAVFFVAPLLVTGFSALFLKEPVGVRRWSALAVGFVGVLVIVQPGAVEFRWAMLLPIAAAIGYATLHTLTRNMGLTERASTMALYIQLTFIVVCTVMGLIFGNGRFAGTGNPAIDFLLREWTWPPTEDLAVIFGLGVCSAAGGYLISQAYRLGEAGLVAPFEYGTLVLAIVWGYVIWNELPGTSSGLGILLILGSGVYVAVRETKFGALPGAKRISGRR